MMWVVAPLSMHQSFLRLESFSSILAAVPACLSLVDSGDEETRSGGVSLPSCSGTPGGRAASLSPSVGMGGNASFRRDKVAIADAHAGDREGAGALVLGVGGANSSA